jgi:hypothetical protein
MEDIDGVVMPDGTKKPGNPNSYIDILEMRANLFKLQHFFNDILPQIKDASSDETTI